MSTKIQERHCARLAYIYLRQSTPAQLRYHQESTERQYALRERAASLGWPPGRIQVLDGDLGLSGAHRGQREDFKTLVADVSMGKVGAVFALEVSRLARSCADWHRLLELCSLSDTLILDEDGCYDLTDFNDQLLLGLKGTMSQAELHLMRARLQGGKRNKARKGELRCPLPVGLAHDAEGRIVLDPDEEVRGAVRLVFAVFRETGSAYAVMRRFADLGLRFPRRTYGGAWAGRLLWGPLAHHRVLGILKNPTYTGAYVYGRHRQTKIVSPEGTVQAHTYVAPMADWEVLLRDHHQGYIGWEEFLGNQQRLEHNRTNGEETLLSGAAREGLALLQGLLLCGRCGRRITVRYKGNGGIYPVYECNHLRRDGQASRACLAVRCERLDAAVGQRALEALTTDQIDLALQAVEQLEQRHTGVSRQWQMRLQRAEYEAQLAQRRYEEVDPANRLVAATLEHRWNEALLHLEQLRQEHQTFTGAQPAPLSTEEKERLRALAEELPRLWHAPNTQAKDKKRLLRLLFQDITVERQRGCAQVVLHLRWQGGATEELLVTLPPKVSDQVRYPAAVVDQVRLLAQTLPDAQIAAQLNREGQRSAKGHPFTCAMIRWIRGRHHLPAPVKRPEERTVAELAGRLGIGHHVVYYWIEHGLLQARRLHGGAPCWITVDEAKEAELRAWIAQSTRIQRQRCPHDP
jgi:DNA invertase Pin-like site-specific DNA recombinase